jgi:hypothetical protein
MPVTALLLVLAQAQVAGPSPRPSSGNSTADFIVERSLALGIDFAPPGPGQTRLAPEEVRTYPGYAAGSWLDSQIQVADDSIAEPPKELRRYLEERREPLWAIVEALEKGSPEWKATSYEEQIPRLMPWIRLHKVLLATALVEERDGRAIEAERALEASWSLGRVFDNEKTLIARILCVSVERWQAGVLRKFREPPSPWVGRLASDEPWRKIAEALETEGTITASQVAPDPDPSEKRLRDSSHKLWTKAADAIAENLRKTSPCDREALTGEAIWRSAAAVFALDSSQEARGLQPIYKEMIQGNVSSMIRRTARLMVDRELTLRILQLRLARAASRDNRWPEETEVTSTVCPGATYGYQAGETKMTIRFQGSVDDPERGVVLPLEYATLDSPAPAAQ